MTEVTFKINGVLHKLDGKYGPDVTLNEYVRNVADLRGTKYMCLEGGCGACVVTVTAPVPPYNNIKTFSVNSCLVSVLSCHGWEVTTVEGIGNRTKGYHPIQQRLASFNGTQCGYCTPGWISNMYSLYQSKKGNLSMVDIENSFAGNICRCTGYRPIADAFKTFAKDVNDELKKKLTDLEDLGMFKLCGVKCKKDCAACKEGYEIIDTNDEKRDSMNFSSDKMIIVESDEHVWYKAYTLDHVFSAIQSGDYRLVAGNTGQGIFPIESYPKNVIDILDVEDLKRYEIDVNLILGAGMPLTEMMEVFEELSDKHEEFSYLKKFNEHMDLVAHIPVRNIGTIGGNLCMKNENKEFQSDIFLLFETVGGMVTIAESVNKKTILSLPEFLNTNLSGKIILNVLLPPLSQRHVIQTYKIMPRSQNAHAAVNAGFLFKFQSDSNSIVEEATLVYGSLTPDFIHASKTEQFLKGKDIFTNKTLQQALKELDKEIVAEEAPPEPSAEYRKQLAIALFYKAIIKLCPYEKIDAKYKSGGDAIKRNISQGIQTYDTDKSVFPVNQPIPKIEGLVQCSGESNYADDFPTQVGEVFAVFVTADVNPGSIVEGFDTTEALNVPGTVAFYSAKDIPGKNSFTPGDIAFMSHDEPILGDKEVKFNGQPFGIMVAKRAAIAAKAAKLVKIKYASVSNNNALVSIADVLDSEQNTERVVPAHAVEPTDKGTDVKKVVKGEFNIEGQYHYTMELQTCVAKPTEDGMEVISSTQWMDLTNVAIAKCLNIPVNSIQVVVRRLGGGFGSKISRATQVACATALVSHLQGKVCRMTLPLRDNMKMIGKRIPTYSNFEIGVNSEGVIQYLNNTFYQDVGSSLNEGIPAVMGTIGHFQNGYNNQTWRLTGNCVVTDTASNTWCRAPSSTEGVAMIEYMMEKIAHQLKKDPIAVKLANLKEKNPVAEMIDQLKQDCNYEERQAEIKQFNNNNRWRKRAVKILPLTYGLMYFGSYNCVINIYHGDGTVLLSHGGIEMGQGINTKAAQTIAYKLGVPLEKISVKPSTSFMSPNAFVTGGSIGSECVVFAAVKACDILVERLRPTKEKLGPEATWEQIVEAANAAEVNLQATYFLSAGNEIQGYDIYAAVAIEVEVDLLTGNHDVRRVDLLEDAGRSLNPEVDVGQIEGAFVMGLGYWTSEKLKYDKATGKLLTDRTWNYKPPGIKDIPADMRVYFRRNANNEFGVLQSKATGEPALCLATSIIHALREAVRASRLEAGFADDWFDIENPCTIENIFMAANHKLEHYKLT